ncbi:hypothetical protein V8C86DRAFT_2651728, partial [Haematococcus lacustris]
MVAGRARAAREATRQLALLGWAPLSTAWGMQGRGRSRARVHMPPLLTTADTPLSHLLTSLTAAGVGIRAGLGRGGAPAAAVEDRALTCATSITHRLHLDCSTRQVHRPTPKKTPPPLLHGTASPCLQSPPSTCPPAAHPAAAAAVRPTTPCLGAGALLPGAGLRTGLGLGQRHSVGSRQQGRPQATTQAQGRTPETLQQDPPGLVGRGIGHLPL